MFKLLKPETTEVPGNRVAATVAARWAALPREQREDTLLLTAGRKMKSEANLAVQAELKVTGEIAASGVQYEVLDRVNATREGARLMRAYQIGHVVEVRTNLPSLGLSRGDRGEVTGVDGDRVRLGMESGAEKVFRPGRLPKNLKYDGVSVFEKKQIEVHVGDRLRWTSNDGTSGLDNGAMARVESVDQGRLTVSSLEDGTVHEIQKSDRMAQHLDLAYAVNVHVAQGVTTKDGIVALRASDGKLLSERSFLVALTRVAEKVSVVLDDGRKIECAVARNSGDKTSAMEVVAGRQAHGSIQMLDTRSPADQALDRYAQFFLAGERIREEGRSLSQNQRRELAGAAAALDRVRPYAAEDLRVVLDRSADPARGLEREVVTGVRQAWAEEGRVRGNPIAYAERFVADWRVASSARETAETGQDKERAERRLERLEERMSQQPALEKALDARMPERQLGLDGPGMGGRSREFEMEM